ncbi:type II secretion system protein N [Alcanivorax quisquiliarum]|uniref:Type II secretion system protein GspC N-terminal domain-containing protein n=1 Tax=Alcanivorax quisquiliarum TaxID=2933565 RepID=A0ABT0E7C5_9GAMM|nr:type II secretion system protein N [Alcanivorax quisquiliarum]MCK0537743.1 hypothetical protein [Alcanivorax quisquiliarum]
MNKKVKVALMLGLLGLLGLSLGTAIMLVDWSSLVTNQNAKGAAAENGRRGIVSSLLVTQAVENTVQLLPSEARSVRPDARDIDESEVHDELSLLALFQAQNSKAASAVVLAKSYGAYRYSVGDQVAGKYLISRIAPDHVLIDVGGKQFKLFLTPLAGGESSQIETAERGQVNGAGILERTRAERERMRLLSTYDLYPVVEGAAAGYVIGERFPRNVREQVGIEPGDFVLSVNGFPLGVLEGDEQAFMSVQTSMKATIVFQRQDGSIFEYHYSENATDH